MKCVSFLHVLFANLVHVKNEKKQEMLPESDL